MGPYGPHYSNNIRAIDDVVEGMIVISRFDARCLIDSVSTHSFVSLGFAGKLESY